LAAFVEILWRAADRRSAQLVERGENDRIPKRGGKIGVYLGDERSGNGGCPQKMQVCNR
jgi:hypothetical protein